MNETDLALLKERYENLKTQMDRIVSHLESERDRIGGVSKRVDTANSSLERLQKQADKFEKILLNSGRDGLVFRMVNLERDGENSEKNWIKWVAILGAINSAGGWIYEIIKA